MGFLSKIFSNNSDMESSDFMTKKGDRFSGVVTDSNRKVFKAERADGTKYSSTQYSNGTVVETRTIKKKKD